MTVRSILRVLSCATGFFFNFRKTKEKMQIKGRIQSSNVFIEIHKFLTFPVVNFFMKGES